MGRSLCSMLGFIICGASLAGCGAGALAYVKQNPPAELQCPASQWQTETTSKPNLLYVNGCGEIVRYVTACNPNGLCMGEEHVVVSQLLRRQASFDLNCSDEISLTRLGEDTFGARGCGRQASYALRECVSGSCKLVQNTQTQ